MGSTDARISLVAISSVHAWHRLGEAIQQIVKRLGRAPIARWVDDYFSANRSDIQWTSSVFLDAILQLIGIKADEKKRVTHALAMQVLGTDVTVNNDAGTMDIQLATEKAHEWTVDLKDDMERGTLPSGKAAKWAGRFQYAVSQASDRIGRTYIKALYAEIHKLMLNDVSGEWLRTSLRWWLKYTEARSISTHRNWQDR